MPLLNRIKFDGLSSREWLIYRHPTDNITLGSTLIVGEGQAAVFVSQGKIADIFTAGSYVLSTMNLPILGSLVNIVYGGVTPFTAEIYYVNLTTKLNMHWGTSDPIQLIDPKYFVRLHIRAFGQFGVKIADISTFIRELIGSLGNTAVKYSAVTDFYKGVLNTKVKTLISDIIINKKISALEITPRLEEISNESMERLKDSFRRYGLEVVNFYIESVNFPDEDMDEINKILQQRAEFEIMGDSRYATKRSFDVYEGAANNSNGVSGAFLAGGVGLGLGSAMLNNSRSTVEPVLESTTECPECGRENKKGAMFCSYCGASIKVKKATCPKCGADLPAGARFCNSCGAAVSESKPKCRECGTTLEPGVKFCHYCGAKQEG